MYRPSELELNKLLGETLQQGASDLHLIVGEPPILRVDGALQKLESYQVQDSEKVGGIVDVILNKGQKELFDAQEAIDVSYAYKEARFRINIYRQKGVVGIAFRFIPNKIKTVQELNLPPKLLDFAGFKQGLVLVVGPTGHGKSTAMAAMVDFINHTRTEHILTIEDPIEFLFNPDQSIISQREIHVDSPSFGQALKDSLRQDINVILVGEMRDLESISSVMTIAETGHLVFATLHTNDAAQSVDRIVDVFPPHQQAQIRTQLSSILLGIVSMRLLPKIGGGRIPAVEILLANSAVRNIIREGKTFELDNVVQTSLEDGMVPLDRSLAMLVRDQVITLDAAQPYVKDYQYFSSLISRG